MPKLGIDERRARLGVRHHLATPATDALGATRALLALHATDPATVFLSVRARSPDSSVERIERALYEDRTLLRMLGMRRTMFVLPTEDAPIVQAACTDAVAATIKRRYAQLLDDAGVGDDAFLDKVGDLTAAALVARGEATGTQLSTDVPALRTVVRRHEDKAYGGAQNITSWVLMLLAADGRAVRGRPKGSWTSTQWAWSPVGAWLPKGMRRIPTVQARAELARRWLARFGPATVADLKWWTGWTMAQVRQALTEVAAVEVDLDDGMGIVLPDDLAPTPPPGRPWVALLPALDASPMGWSNRSWFLGPHASALFDRSGNIGPTIWSDGRIVGGWAQRKSGEIVTRLLEPCARDVVRAVEADAVKLAAWIGPVRVTPRFRTPLEKELTA